MKNCPYPSPVEHLLYRATTEYPYPEVEQWCLDHVGPWKDTWYKLGQDMAAVIVDYRTQEYWFKFEEDRLMFVLRWGS
jgi:hypothetical protein